MSDRRRDEGRDVKKDQQVRREVLDEIGSEIAQHTEAQYRNPNRDQARGDWDRSGRHTDEGMSRESDKLDDDGVEPQERPVIPD